MKTIEKDDVCLLDVVDRMEHERSMVEFLRNNTQDKELEGWCAVLSERIEMTQTMLHFIIKSEIPEQQ